MSKIALYNNRYGDTIVFSEINENEIHMSGFNMEWMRCGRNGDNTSNIIMIDPSGGPYLVIGSNLKRYFEDDKDRFIKLITIDIDKIIFKIN